MSRRLMVSAVVWVVVLAVARVAVAPAELCPPVDPATLRTGIDGARTWLVANSNDDGTFRYAYDRDRDETLPGYSLTRHSGVLMALYQLAVVGGDDGGVPTADRGLDWALARLVPAGGGRAFAETGTVDTGASALLAVALTFRRELTADLGRDAVLVDLGRFLAGQVNERGQVLARWDPATGAPVPDETSVYFTGETWWALVRLAVAFPGEGFEAPFLRIADYVATERDEVERMSPPNDDHWAAYSMAEMAGHGWTLTAAQLDYAERLASLWSPEVRFDAQRTGEGLNGVVRGPTNRGAQQGTNTEGLSALWRLAVSQPRPHDQRDRVAGLAVCGAAILAERQVTPEEAAAAPDPGAVEGAWFRRGVTRMDVQQHAMSGLLGSLGVLEATGGPEPGPRLGQWALGVLGALAAAGLTVSAVRRWGRGTAAGHGATAVLWVGLAFGASPLLRALDIHPVTARLLVATALLGTAATRLWRAPRPDHPAPLLADPALSLVVLWAAGDLGLALGLPVLALGLGAGLAVSLAHLRVARYASPLLTAALAVLGVEFLFDGIFGL